MTAAEIASTRQLLGLSRLELTMMLPLGRRTGRPLSTHTIKDLESGRLTAVEWIVQVLRALRVKHDQEAARLIAVARDGVPIDLPSGPNPSGWYLALGARVIAAVPDATLRWSDTSAR